MNGNKNIKKIDIGILTNRGLADLATLLRPNDSLEELEIAETKDHQKYWNQVGRDAFTEMLRESTVLKKVTLKFEGKDEEANE